MIYLYLAVSTIAYAFLYYCMLLMFTEKLAEKSYLSLFLIVLLNIALPFLTFYVFINYFL